MEFPQLIEIIDILMAPNLYLSIWNENVLSAGCIAHGVLTLCSMPFALSDYTHHSIIPLFQYSN